VQERSDADLLDAVAVETESGGAMSHQVV
jgi:hypothetical protein